MKQKFKFIRNLALRAFILSFAIVLIQYQISAQEFHGGTSPPSYKGGNEVLKKFIGNNLNFPDVAKKAGICGTVTLKLLIDESGKVKNVKLMRGIQEACDLEAIKVAQLLKDWQPALNFGKPISCNILLQIEFRNENNSSNNQPIVVKGNVTDKSTGKPIEGCLVLIKGTTNGTLTDGSGRYELSIPEESSNLEISSMGYVSKTEQIDKNCTINVELESEYFIINY